MKTKIFEGLTKQQIENDINIFFINNKNYYLEIKHLSFSTNLNLIGKMKYFALVIYELNKITP